MTTQDYRRAAAELREHRRWMLDRIGYYYAPAPNSGWLTLAVHLQRIKKGKVYVAQTPADKDRIRMINAWLEHHKNR